MYHWQVARHLVAHFSPLELASQKKENEKFNVSSTTMAIVVDSIQISRLSLRDASRQKMQNDDDLNDLILVVDVRNDFNFSREYMNQFRSSIEYTLERAVEWIAETKMKIVDTKLMKFSTYLSLDHDITFNECICPSLAFMPQHICNLIGFWTHTIQITVH